MRDKRENIFISIIKESPIYAELDREEKHILIRDLKLIYPHFFKESHEDTKVGREANCLRTRY